MLYEINVLILSSVLATAPKGGQLAIMHLSILNLTSISGSPTGDLTSKFA